MSRSGDLSSGNPDPDLLLWRHDRWPTAVAANLLLYGTPRIVDALLVPAQAYLAGQGVANDHLTALPGGLEAVDRALATLLRPGDRVIVESPTYNGDLPLIAALGLVPVPVPVDEEGLRPEPFVAALRDAAGVLYRPRAQNPTGAALTSGRGNTLRAIIERFPSLLVIEEDHAGGIAGADYHSAIPAGHPRWLHVASVSKWLAPDLRFALVSGDRESIQQVDQRRLLGGGWISRMTQLAVAAHLADPDLAADLARVRDEYGRRRRHVLDLLAERGLRGYGRTGLNVWIEVPDEAETVSRLARRGWQVAPGSRFAAPTPAIRVTVAALAVAQAQRFADDLLSATRGPGRVAD
ncbi:aminotransferase class I/II-fold pyridoxal phosphate-dependent enzyme [Verrucosispora sp. WMMD703]|uniref:aminotransferase class I/II-fold pyridoxal phosphate-dependent enzyme n=1 Tax=Verrucosispora sp. WMMD703 TaxID=3403463 RepID=UPI003B9497E4